jgi:hypothetical protein
MDWRYQPLAGESGFRARGLAYAAALRYVDKKLPGGRAAFDAAVADAGFYRQLFLAISDYDVAPLVRLFNVAARLEGVAVGDFIAARARWSGDADSKGVWKRPLSGSTAAEVADRLHFAFNRYFPPCEARSLSTADQRFEGELMKVPSCMDGLYVHTTAGFFQGALEGAGARAVNVQLSPPVAAGNHGGVPVERIHFAVTWS